MNYANGIIWIFIERRLCYVKTVVARARQMVISFLVGKIIRYAVARYAFMLSVDS